MSSETNNITTASTAMHYSITPFLNADTCGMLINNFQVAFSVQIPSAIRQDK